MPRPRSGLISYKCLYNAGFGTKALCIATSTNSCSLNVPEKPETHNKHTTQHRNKHENQLSKIRASQSKAQLHRAVAGGSSILIRS